MSRIATEWPVCARVPQGDESRPGVPVSQVLRNVRSEVARLARTVGHEQVPALYDQAIGDFYFRPPVDQLAQAPVVTASPLSARAAYASGTVFRDCPDCPEMVVIPAGEFSMGSPAKKGATRTKGLHQVRIGKAFALGRKELTVGEFGRFVQASGYRTSARRTPARAAMPGDKSDGKWDWRAGREWSEPGLCAGRAAAGRLRELGRCRAVRAVAGERLARATGCRARRPTRGRGGGKTARPGRQSEGRLQPCQRGRQYDLRRHILGTKARLQRRLLVPAPAGPVTRRTASAFTT